MSDTRDPWAYPEPEPSSQTPPTPPAPHPAYANTTPYAAPQSQYQQPYQQPKLLPQSSGNGMAVAALVLGIVGIPLFAALFPEVLAIIFGRLMMNKRQPGEPGRNLAVAGFVLGIIGASFFVIYVISTATNPNQQSHP